MSNFKNALNMTIDEMTENAGNSTFCADIYWDGCIQDSAMVMFMEYENYSSMHAVMKDLHARLSEKIGHPVSVCHNDPTDENVLIHGNSMDSRVYYSDNCCKEDTIRAYHGWVNSDRTGYRDELVALFKGAEAYADMCGYEVEEVFSKINWNKDPQAQLIDLFSKAYWDAQA
jgi:thiamine kinase-like enzyme